MKAAANVALFVRGNMLSFVMSDTQICMLGTGSQLSNYWQNVLNAIFEIPPECWLPWRCHFCSLRNRAANKDT